jgi:hypothetical protein
MQVWILRTRQELLNIARNPTTVTQSSSLWHSRSVESPIDDDDDNNNNNIIRISHFSALAGRYSPILGSIINRSMLGGLMCNLGNFIQLNMCQELPLFAFVYMCLGVGYYYYYFIIIITHLAKQSCQSLHFYLQIANTVYAYYTILKNAADS